MKAPELAVLNAWTTTATEANRKRHWEWFVIDQFLRGNHNVKGNPNDNTIEVTRRVDSVSYPINKIYSTFRSVRAFVTRHKPIVMVEPTNSSEEAKAYARRANKLLERDNIINNFMKINKEWVYYGVKYGIGYRQVGYDPVKKCAIRWSVDPFDLLLAEPDSEMEDNPYIIKTVRRTMDYLVNKYPKVKDQLAPDDMLAFDEYKRLGLEINYQNVGNANPVAQQTLIVKEIWYRLYKPNKAQGLVNKVTCTENLILDFEETPYTDFPFISYKSDIVPNESSGEGHIKHIISPQRMLNLLNTHALEYNHLVNRGRFLIDKNAGFQVINSREGQIIRKNRGASVEVLNPPGVNPMLDRQIGMANEYIEDIGGQHQASMGATPQRVSSGDAIEALQTGDSNNISDLRDNFEDSLSQEAAWILKLYSLFEADGIVLHNKVTDEEEEQFAVVGQQAMQRTGREIPQQGYFMEDNGDYCEACTILPDNQVKVSVSSQLGETRQAKIELLMRLVELGLPLVELLKYLEFPNTSDIFERIAQEQLADLAMQQMQAQLAQPPQPGMPPQGGQDPAAILDQVAALDQQAQSLTQEE